MGEKIIVNELYRGSGGAISQNDNITSDLIDLRHIGIAGYFSLHVITVGGTLTATLLVCSTEDGTYVAPDTAITILDAVAAGTHFASFSPPLAPFIKIKFTETNVDDITSMDAWLNVQ